MSQLDIAQIIWKRFANSSVETWEDETHKAEYLDCAREIANAMQDGSQSAAPIKAPEHERG